MGSLGGAVAVLATRRPWTTPLGNGGLGRLPTETLVDAKQVSIEGEPWETRVVRVDGRRALTLSSRWDDTALTWLADRIHEQTGLPVRDERDVGLWRMWEQDSLFRAQNRVQRALAASREAFPELHDTSATPIEGPATKRTLHGMQVTLHNQLLVPYGFRMEDGTLHIANRTMPLTSVDAVEVVFGLSGWPVTARLIVRAGDEVCRTAALGLNAQRTAGHMHWAAQQIRDAVAAAKRAEPVDHGDAEDIPEALARMRRASNAAP